MTWVGYSGIAFELPDYHRQRLVAAKVLVILKALGLRMAGFIVAAVLTSLNNRRPSEANERIGVS